MAATSTPIDSIGMENKVNGRICQYKGKHAPEESKLKQALPHAFT
jgi:hypothetical protein